MTALSLSLTLPDPIGGQHCDVGFNPGEISAIAGPSGMGKSSLLLAIAGLLPGVTGNIALGDQPWLQDGNVILPPDRRNIGFVFQDDRLFSHMTVAGNLAWVRKRRQNAVSPAEEQSILKALDLEPLLAKPVTQLSGGERKRTAIARALIGSPDWLLLDEPFNGLDQNRAGRLAALLEDEMAWRDGAMGILLVSHDNREIARLADKVFDLDATGIHRRTDYHLVDGAYLKGLVKMVDTDWHLTHVDICQGSHHCQWQIAGQFGPAGREIGLFVDARDVAISLGKPAASSMRNQIAGRISAIRVEDDPAYLRVDLDCSGIGLQARITKKSAHDLALAPDMPVYALIKSVALDHFI